ncbi:hypothetical protein OG885_01650 [Streptomyces sp. NBC_00028]|uniref:hypothetical protein n=1 Tax=Streptomyces sp. NBC_00028 TaxID=2975624 RepID=UPI0032447D5A
MTNELSQTPEAAREARGPARHTHRLGLNKVPQVTVYFWIIKVLCTTVGETAADLLNEKAGLGLTGVSALMSALLAVVLVVQFRTSAYRAGVYWPAVALISVVGTQAPRLPASWGASEDAEFSARKRSDRQRPAPTCPDMRAWPPPETMNSAKVRPRRAGRARLHAGRVRRATSVRIRHEARGKETQTCVESSCTRAGTSGSKTARTRRSSSPPTRS